MSRTSLAVLIAVCSLASSLVAQNAPPPAAPPAPFTGYLGRFLDSSQTPEWFYPNRTLRTDRIKMDGEHDRIYIQAGNGYFIGYALSSFASRIGSPLATGPHGEQYLPWTMRVNAETTGWSIIQADGALRLADFDFDDRGYIYLAYSLFGWGTVDQTGRLINQIPNQTGYPTPLHILTFASGGKQYVIVSSGSVSTLWDVTDVNGSPGPINKGSVPLSISRYAKNRAGDAIAIMTSSSAIQIYTPEQLAGSGTPITIQPATGTSFTDVTSDGVNFYASEDGAQDFVAIIAPADAGYTKTDVPTMVHLSTLSLAWGAGYLGWIGFSSTNTGGALFAFNGTTFTQTDITSYLQANYATSGTYIQPRQFVAYCNDAGTFALLAAHGLGDFFSMTPAVSTCLPGPPTNVTAAAGNASASVSFTAPSFDGGSVVSSYTVTSNPHAITATGTSSPVTVNGLADGVAYTFTVVARNGVGISGPSAASTAVTPTGPLVPPAFVTATPYSGYVNIGWPAVSGALYYEILRSTSIAGPFSVIGTSNTFGLTYTDGSVAPDTTYLYAVRSVDGASAKSSNSPWDYATTVAFTDNPVSAGVIARAVHLTELRTAVNAMRAAAGLPSAVFTDPTIDSSITIKALHISEVRSALDEARNAMGLPQVSYTDAVLAPGVSIVRAADVQEIRDAVK